MALSPRRVEVSIDEVVVEGVAIEDEALFAAALRSHLANALTRLPAPSRSSERVDGGSVRIAARATPGEVGAGVARAVARAVGGAGDGPVTTQ